MTDYLVNQVQNLVSWIWQNPVTTIFAVITLAIVVFYCRKIIQRYYNDGCSEILACPSAHRYISAIDEHAVKALSCQLSLPRIL
jgi:hypothetical protein